MPSRLRPSIDQLAERASTLAIAGERRILAIAGSPGAGKSTLALAVVARLGERAQYLPMDGFHLANAELRRLGRQDSKGAPDTFDGDGFVELLRRVRRASGETVYAPDFDRSINEPVAASIAIPPDVPLVVTEGNYILLDQPPWSQIRGIVDETWYLEAPDDLRVERLIARHVHYGRSYLDAQEWVHRSDERNAGLIRTTRGLADLVIAEMDA